MNVYETICGDSRDLRQGDLLYPVAFARFSLTEALVVSPDSPQPKTTNLAKNFDSDQTQLVVNADRSYGMVINQSCDLSVRSNRERPILVARVTPCSKRIKGWAEKTSDKSRAKSVLELSNPGKHPAVFYLPEFVYGGTRVEPSVVDLLDMTTFVPKDIDALVQCRCIRLSAVALQALQERLAYCFGRFGAPDNFFLSETERAALGEE